MIYCNTFNFLYLYYCSQASKILPYACKGILLDGLECSNSYVIDCSILRIHQYFQSTVTLSYSISGQVLRGGVRDVGAVRPLQDDDRAAQGWNYRTSTVSELPYPQQNGRYSTHVYCKLQYPLFKSCSYSKSTVASVIVTYRNLHSNESIKSSVSNLTVILFQFVIPAGRLFKAETRTEDVPILPSTPILNELTERYTVGLR